MTREHGALRKATKAAAAFLIAVLLAIQPIPLAGLPEGRAYAQTASSHAIAKNICQISQYVNGVHDHDFSEGVLGVDGDVAFCMDPNINFKPGSVESANILSSFTQEQVTDMALRAHYVRSVYQDSNVSENARIMVAQTLVWEVIAPGQGFLVVAAENGGGFAELSAAVRDDMMAKARQFARENASRYRAYGTLWVRGSTQPVATLGCELAVGTIELVKRSALPDVTGGNGCYSLEGARYVVYGDAACTQEVGELVTDASGYAKSGELHVGTYYVREEAAPAGYAADGTAYAVEVRAGQTTRVNGSQVTDAPLVRDGLVPLVKHDAETEWDRFVNDALGAATLEGARYSVSHYAGAYASVDEAEASGLPARTWEFATDGNGLIDLANPEAYVVSGTLYRDANGHAVFPLGTYVVREATPSDGYLLSDEAYLLTVAQDGAQAALSGDTLERDGVQHVVDAEQVKRADLALTKVREADMARLAGVPFRLTSETTGESHVLVTDENGRIDTSSSWNAHTNRTNANDAAVGDDGRVDEALLDAEAGVWFGLRADGSTTDADDRLGALPYDTYTLEEIACPANGGLVLVRIEGISVKRDSVVVDLGTVDDKNDVLPLIDTHAFDARDGDKGVSAEEGAVVTDEIELVNLDPGRSYRLYGTVIDVRTGLPAMAAGRDVSASEEGEPGDPGDGVDVQAGLTSADDTERRVPTQEGVREFWDGLVELLGAERIESGDGISYAIAPGTRVDAEAISAYMAQNEGVSSAMVVAQMDVEQGVEKTVASLDYGMDASQMEGTYVIYDLLVSDGEVMAVHADTANEMESFEVEQPRLQTEASDAADGDHVFLPSLDTRVIDTVSYAGLVPGREYELSGMLVHKSDGSLLEAEGAPVESTKTFVADAASGTVQVEFEFDSTGLAPGTQLVAYEFLTLDGEDVAQHADLASEPQTMTLGSLPEGKGYYKTGADDAENAPTMVALGALAGAGLFVGRRKLAGVRRA